MSGARLLIIDDDPAIARALRPALNGFGFDVAVAVTAAEGLAQVQDFAPDLILLDLGLPDADGVELTTQLRELTDVPIIVLSVRNAESDKIGALDNGANDYVTKPFSIGELLARIRVALRHRDDPATGQRSASRLQVGDVLLDSKRHEMRVKGVPVHFSPTEFNLLELLMRRAGELVTHRTLLYKVWGPKYIEDTQLLRVYIAQIRNKIEEHPEHPLYIVTEPGIGYRFCDVSDSDAF
jgi:two-component system, OmpR family, KDP operon response regulator KdpE